MTDEVANTIRPLTLREIEWLAILDALDRNNYVVNLAARELGVGRTTVYRRLKENRKPLETLRSEP